MDNGLTAQVQGKRHDIALIGAHGPICIDIEVMPQQSLRTYYHLDARSAGLEIRYYGHKDDLRVAGCLQSAGRYDYFHDDGHGGVWCLTSKAGPKRRGYVAIAYYTCNRAFAASLPAVRHVFPEGLAQIGTHPSLRLVVDNTNGAEGRRRDD